MMNRRIFMETLAEGIILNTFLKNIESKTEKMPTLFLGHGSPMNAIQNNEYTQF